MTKVDEIQRLRSAIEDRRSPGQDYIHLKKELYRAAKVLKDEYNMLPTELADEVHDLIGEKEAEGDIQQVTLEWVEALMNDSYYSRVVT